MFNFFSNKENEDTVEEQPEDKNLTDFLEHFCIPKNIHEFELNENLLKSLFTNHRIVQDTKLLLGSLTDLDRSLYEKMINIKGIYLTRQAHFMGFSFMYNIANARTTWIDSKPYYLIEHLDIFYKDNRIISIQELVSSDQEEEQTPEPMYNIVEDIPELANHALFVCKYIIDNARYIKDAERQEIIEEVNELTCKR